MCIDIEIRACIDGMAGSIVVELFNISYLTKLPSSSPAVTARQIICSLLKIKLLDLTDAKNGRYSGGILRVNEQVAKSKTMDVIDE